MPVAWIPPLMQKLTQGQAQVQVQGETVRQIIDHLETLYPGFRARVCNEEGRLKPEIAVAVDGEVITQGLRASVKPQSEVHFLPALSGG
jgi:molybdopterin synthase sulfur carrier subunit